MALGPFRSMTTETGLFQDGLDVAVEINPDAGRRRQLNPGNFSGLGSLASEYKHQRGRQGLEQVLSAGLHRQGALNT